MMFEHFTWMRTAGNQKNSNSDSLHYMQLFFQDEQLTVIQPDFESDNLF